jgi:hypothetical protein
VINTLDKDASPRNPAIGREVEGELDRYVTRDLWKVALQAPPLRNGRTYSA